jgi:hypothetical protein
LSDPREVGRRCRTALAVAVTLLASCAVAAGPADAAANWSVGLAAGSGGQARSDVLSAPAGVTATCVTGTKTVNVSWSAVTHAASYTVQQSTTSATAGFSNAVTGVTATNWTTGTLSNGSYWYSVVAVAGNWSSTVSATAGPRIIQGQCS